MVLPHPPYRPTPDSDLEKDPDKQQLFGDMVAYIDKVVGQIADKLDGLNLRSNTLILFTADNGTNTNIVSQMGDREIQGGKALLTDAGTHVPLIVSWPGTAPEGQVRDDLVDFTDFMPTLAQVTQAPLPEGVIIDGHSFAPQIKGQQGHPREWIFSHYEPRFPWKEYGTTIWVRDQRWKLYDSGSFFDVQNDPLEENPLKPADLTQEALAAKERLRKALGQMLDGYASK
jgi:arylsulfatase A